MVKRLIETIQKGEVGERKGKMVKRVVKIFQFQMKEERGEVVKRLVIT